MRGNDNAFVSRGGKKIEKALNYFAIDPSGLTVHGRRRIDRRLYRLPAAAAARRRSTPSTSAMASSHGACGSDPRVVVHGADEYPLCNAGVCSSETASTLSVVDVSFISLKIVLPAVASLLKPTGQVAWLPHQAAV